MTENEKRSQPPQTTKKRRFKKRYWLLVDLLIAIVITILMFYRPNQYTPPTPLETNEVSTYLTHQLMTQFYNGTQRREPFDLIVTQDGLNDILSHSNWAGQHQATKLTNPCVLFTDEKIILMASADVKAMRLIVSIVIEPMIEKQGLLSLKVSKFKVGAMNLTFFARVMAKKMYQNRIKTGYIDTTDIRTKIAGAFLNDKPFEPVFEIQGQKVRAEKITITQDKLIIRLTPIS
jgi:uncharacterized protein YpmS